MSDWADVRRSIPVATRRVSAPAALVFALVATLSGCGEARDADGPAGGSPTTNEPAGTPQPTTQPTAAPAATPPSDPATWPLVWSDEFDGPEGSPPDADSWDFELGDGSDVGLVGWGNNERQSYTDSPDNAALDGDGNLVLTVRRGDGTQTCYYGPCEYTSARLVTRDRVQFEYGRIEARIRVPDGFGLWPAFWMLGANHGQVGWPASGEIDVMEYLGRRPNDVIGTVHGPGYSASSGPSQAVRLDAPVSDDFHTFGIEWWSGHIAWFIDGTKFHEVSAADVAPDAWVFDQPFFLILNVAVGGNLGGPVDPALDLPRAMAIDYIRVYQPVLP